MEFKNLAKIVCMSLFYIITQGQMKNQEYQNINKCIESKNFDFVISTGH